MDNPSKGNIMATNPGVDLHRTALALVQANKAQDTDAVIAVLAMVKAHHVGTFLAALADMVHYAHACDPADGWEDFTERYSAALDVADAISDQ